MSLRGRYVIDRIKSVISNHFRLPCPPYGDPFYWDAAYKSLGPNDSYYYEWGDVSLKDVMEYSYRPVPQWDVNAMSSSKTFQTTSKLQSTLGEALNGLPNNAEKDQPILMLGCGNSRFGEEMIQQGWRGPLLQVDVSSRVIEMMSHRCHELITNGHMNFVQDDACELSAFRDGMMDACLDKGLLDALYCAEEYDQLTQILKSVGRVLRPGGAFVFFSFSRPEFLLPRLMKDEMQDIRRRQWTNLKVEELEKIFLYKMQTANTEKVDPLRYQPSRIRKDKFRR